MTVEGLTEVVKTIAANYRYTYKDCSDEIMQTMIVSWYKGLIDYSDEDVNKAFLICLRKCKSPPTIADIIERIEKMREVKRPSKAEIWEKVISAVNSLKQQVYVPNVGYRYLYTLKNDDCRAKFSELPRSVKKWLGFDTFCAYAEMSATALSVERARFMKEIDDIRETLREAEQISVIEHLLLNGDNKLLAGGVKNV